MSFTPTSVDDAQIPRKLWLVLVILGVITLAGGILALAYPDITVEVLAIILGINLLLFAILDFVDAFTGDADNTGKTLQVILGLVGLIAGIICLRRPSEALTFIVIVIALWLVLAGAVLILRAIFNAGNRLARGITGVVVLAIGVAIISWPHIGLGTLVILTAIALIIRGVYAIAAGFALKSLTT